MITPGSSSDDRSCLGFRVVATCVAGRRRSCARPVLPNPSNADVSARQDRVSRHFPRHQRACPEDALTKALLRSYSCCATQGHLENTGESHDSGEQSKPCDLSVDTIVVKFYVALKAYNSRPLRKKGYEFSTFCCAS